MIDSHERDLIRQFVDTRLKARRREAKSDDVPLRKSDVLRAEYFIDLLLSELPDATPQHSETPNR